MESIKDVKQCYKDLICSIIVKGAVYSLIFVSIQLPK